MGGAEDVMGIPDRDRAGLPGLPARLAAAPGRLPGRAWAALAPTLGIAAASWALTLRQVTGMDMGTGTRLGPASPFAVTWMAMMAAMMLPGAAPAGAQHAL